MNGNATKYCKGSVEYHFINENLVCKLRSIPFYSLFIIEFILISLLEYDPENWKLVAIIEHITYKITLICIIVIAMKSPNLLNRVTGNTKRNCIIHAYILNEFSSAHIESLLTSNTSLIILTTKVLPITV